jgi:hypothetical protein
VTRTKPFCLNPDTNQGANNTSHCSTSLYFFVCFLAKLLTRVTNSPRLVNLIQNGQYDEKKTTLFLFCGGSQEAFECLIKPMAKKGPPMGFIAL